MPLSSTFASRRREKLIYASSSSFTGGHLFLPERSDEIKARSRATRSRRVMSDVTRALRHSADRVRLFSVYGPGAVQNAIGVQEAICGRRSPLYGRGDAPDSLIDDVVAGICGDRAPAAAVAHPSRLQCRLGPAGRRGGGAMTKGSRQANGDRDTPVPAARWRSRRGHFAGVGFGYRRGALEEGSSASCTGTPFSRA